MARHLAAMARELHERGHRIVSLSAKSLLEWQDGAFERLRARLPPGDE